MATRILDVTAPGTGQAFPVGRKTNFQITVLNTGTDGMTYGGLVEVYGSNDTLGWFRIISHVVQSSSGFVATGNARDIGVWDLVRANVVGMDANARIIVTAMDTLD